jgi:DNA-binding HxlR family transcriptional regulator
VEYSLSPLGWSITGPLLAMYEWAADNLRREDTAPRLSVVAA